MSFEVTNGKQVAEFDEFQVHVLRDPVRVTRFWFDYGGLDHYAFVLHEADTFIHCEARNISVFENLKEFDYTLENVLDMWLSVTVSEELDGEHDWARAIPRISPGLTGRYFRRGFKSYQELSVVYLGESQGVHLVFSLLPLDVDWDAFGQEIAENLRIEAKR